MNSNEFEHWLKDKIEEIPFTADDKGWEKLSAHLASGPKRAGILFFGFYHKVAAAILFMLAGTGAYLYWAPEGDSGVKQTVYRQQPAASDIITKQESFSSHKATVLTAETARVLPGKTIKKQINIQPVASPAKAQITKENENRTYLAAGTEQHKTTEAQINKQTGLPDFSKNYPEMAMLSESSPTGQTDFLLSLQTGFQQLGGVQYQVGFAPRVNLSSRFFMDGTVTLAASQLAYSEPYTFSGMKVSSDITQPGSAIFAVRTATQVEATYKQPIYSLGIAPALGYRINQRLSISAGSYLNRNINTDVYITGSNDEVTQSLISEGTISTMQKVRDWDWGIISSTEYNIHNRFKVQIGYRIGLSNFLLADNKNIRNTGFNMGLKYNFSKD